MGKNQHVTPHPDGGWQVKGRETLVQQFVLKHRRKPLTSLVTLRVTRNLNFSFMEKTVGFVSAILMGMTRIRLKVN